MKRHLFYMTTIAVLAAIFTSCKPDITTIPRSVRLNHSYIRLAPGESLTLTADVRPVDAAIKSVTWSSSNRDVATVNSDGVVTAIAEGKANITVTTNSGQKSTFCELTVAYSVSSVTLDQTVSVLSVGKNTRLTATVLPEDAPDKSVRWESSNPDVATVNDTGEVVAKSPGIATISVITEVGSRIAKCTVKIPSAKDYIAIILQQPVGVGIYMTGTGTVEIDWGDGYIETKTLSTAGLHYSRSYSDIISRAIIISGGNITRFDCNNPQLTGLDVSNHTALVTLNCFNTQLTNLDASKNINLAELNCYNSRLTSLDMSANTLLTKLNCSDNQLTDLNVSNNTELLELNCSKNRLISLDVSVSTKLTVLNCSNNHLTSLGVNTNTELTRLDCNSNQLTSLDMSKNTTLRTLFCFNNQLTNLDLINNPALANLLCNNNQLISLVVSNSIGLTSLSCSNNQLTSLNVSNSVALTFLSCSNNQLKNLDVNANTALTRLDCNSNQLTNFDVSNNTELEELNCSSNQLISLVMGSNTRLTNLNCSDNQLTSLDVSGNIALTRLECQHNQLSNNALNELFGTLRPFFSSFTAMMGRIYISDNPGANTCSQSIARGRGWLVYN